MPEAKVFDANGTDVSQAIIKSVQISATRANILRNVLSEIEGGEPWNNTILRASSTIGGDISASVYEKILWRGYRQR